jgi:hypothetical protein
MTEKRKLDPMAIVDKLAAEERRLSEGTFLAPVIDGSRVRVRVKGIVYEMALEDHFEGWAILRMSAPGKAQVIEQAPPALVDKYLQLFPRIRVVMLQMFGKQWWALGAAAGDTRFQFNAPVPINLVGTATRFDTAYCRFDGSVFWFETIDRRRDPKISRTLNKALTDKIRPDDLRCPGAVPQEKLAYRMLWLAENEDGPPEDSDLSRITRALQHAGAALETFWYQDGDQATVRFTLDGQARSVQVRTSDLAIVSAGICLSGQDQNFDLTSLVGVFREAANQEYD